MGYKMNYLTIGEVAKRSNVTVEAIRFYEKKLLILKPHRTTSGYRQYTADTVKRILFIQRAKVVGFSLKEIRELLSLKEISNSHANDEKSNLKGKIDDINKRILVLNEIRNALTTLHDPSDSLPKSTDSPILNAFDNV